MNAEQQMNYFTDTACWLESEKERLLAIVSQPGRARHHARARLLEISDRTRQLNREFEKFKKTTTTP